MLEINNANFEELILKSDKLVIVDFFAEWCGPCKKMTPIMEEISKKNPDIVVGKVNVDESTETSNKYGVKSIPTLVFIKNGEVVGKSIGFSTEGTIMEKINSILKD